MSSGDASVKLDRLGPMVVNADGTLSRISNWDKMADNEKETTLRIIGKQNQARLGQLRAKEGAQCAHDLGVRAPGSTSAIESAHHYSRYSGALYNFLPC
jgi:hypothetical protein